MRAIKGDITKITGIQAIVNAANAFDDVCWVLFDNYTLSVYEKEMAEV